MIKTQLGVQLMSKLCQRENACFENSKGYLLITWETGTIIVVLRGRLW